MISKYILLFPAAGYHKIIVDMGKFRQQFKIQDINAYYRIKFFIPFASYISLRLFSPEVP